MTTRTGRTTTRCPGGRITPRFSIGSDSRSPRIAVSWRSPRTLTPKIRPAPCRTADPPFVAGVEKLASHPERWRDRDEGDSTVPELRRPHRGGVSLLPFGARGRDHGAATLPRH